MNLNESRKQLAFNSGLLQLIETLKNIAATHYHLLDREKRNRFAHFVEAFSGFFHVVNLVDVPNPLVRATSEATGILVVTSDAGFMGGLNSAVTRRATALWKQAGETNARYIVIGEKGASHFSDLDRRFKAFRGIDYDTRYEQAEELRNYLVTEFLEERLGRVQVVYPRPVSFTQQIVEVFDLLPCGQVFDAASREQPAGQPEPVTGRMGHFIRRSRQVIVESPYSDVVTYLAGVWITAKLMEVFEDSKLSEFAARAMHLENSLQTLEQNQRKLKYLTFRAAHEMVDKGMRESFSSKKLRSRSA